MATRKKATEAAEVNKDTEAAAVAAENAQEGAERVEGEIISPRSLTGQRFWKSTN